MSGRAFSFSTLPTNSRNACYPLPMNSTTLEPTQKASAYEVKRQRTMGKKKVTIIGSGFSGMSAACHLATDYDVVVLEKNDTPGGRGRKFEAEGFVFDMGLL